MRHFLCAKCMFNQKKETPYKETPGPTFCRTDVSLLGRFFTAPPRIKNYLLFILSCIYDTIDPVINGITTK